MTAYAACFFPVSRNNYVSDPLTMDKPLYDFDFAVVGGGPAGASAAISLGQLGHSVVLFERDTFRDFISASRCCRPPTTRSLL
jgi:hypothetical protein